MVASGKRLTTKTGHIADIGITKVDLTEEDLAIERGFKEIIMAFDGEHTLYAEEENDFYQPTENIWVVDPISGTHNFIKGLPHYTIVITHLVNHQAVFAAVYDPSADELFTAYAGQGAFLNGQPIKVSQNSANNVIYRKSSQWQDLEAAKLVLDSLSGYQIENKRCSMAANYSWIACGRFDGIVAFTKDAFPEYAGSLIIKEAGGIFTNLEGKADILPTDRIFVAGNKKTYDELLALAQKAIKN